uniref:Peptidase M48 domain-containing protein n=1 Tax=Pseudo-nitzschia australis TaxID=44445 RepID=A0A7S4EQH1_9STRA|mmetsp:Transcript_7489/g.16136  ORF Transcript_7489/g.16136 Transcript_7489/m.16136 type:complete len:345 (-) Transcript_7489:180-1214(-)
MQLFLIILVSQWLMSPTLVCDAFTTGAKRRVFRLHPELRQGPLRVSREDMNEVLDVPNSSESPSRIPSLESDQFRHPLDQRLTSLVRNAPFYGLAEETIRRAFPLIEQGVRLDLMASSVKVSPQQLPELHDLLIEACDVLNFSSTFVPELYVQSNPQANAYTLAIQSRSNGKPDKEGDDYSSSVIVVTSALVDRCTPRELQAVLGHELGHLKCEHALYLTLGNIASSPLSRLPVMGSRVDSALQDWRLAAEYSCDRAALLVAQDSKIVANALMKLFAGTSRYEFNTKAFIEQSLDYERQLETANPLVRMSIERQQRTHPLPVRRVAELEKWFQSDEYRNLLPSQ